MIDRAVAPYGSWRSPISAAAVAGAASRIGHLVVDGGDLYWSESRPHEGGRNVVVRRTPDGRIADVTPPPFNARTRVHEYGGGEFAVAAGVVYFANFADQRLYRLDVSGGGPAATPQALTSEAPRRYADGVVDTSRRRLICVREDHSVAGSPPSNAVVAVTLEGDAGAETVLVSGNDFYSTPRLSPDGRRLAWLTWNHPNMPWDGTELWVGQLTPDGAVAESRLVAGGIEESVFQPEWGPDGTLYFVSDRSGWWNLYRWAEASGAVRSAGDGSTIEALAPREAEFGQPQWNFGNATYGFREAGGGTEIVCTFAERGSWRLGRLDLTRQQLTPVAVAYTDVRNLRVLPGGRAVLVAGSPSQPPQLVEVDLETGAVDVLRRTSDVVVDPGYLSVPRAVEFPTTGGKTAHALYYPPVNRDFCAPPGELPPLLVKSHGGPTSATSSTLTLGTQYWTSRGIAVLDVNYGGSTGYGRAYRQRLNGQWGVVDVDDCVNGARFLADAAEVDPRRLAISGGSAGGFTTLCALTFTDTFAAGASYFGVSDIESLLSDDHKFESRYTERLVGPFPAAREIYRQRSPIHNVDRLARPVIFFQGLEDVIVPPSHSETMVDALRAKGVPVAYLPFPGEQHGFRRAEHIARSLDAELYFYGRIFGFRLADAVEPVTIENLSNERIR